MVREYNLEPEISRFIAVLKERAEQICHVSYVAAYADFDNPDFHGLQSEFQRNNVETRHVFSKTFGATRKNAADIEMSLDAQEMSATRPDITTFVLVCGDRDFIPIVKRLQQKGKQVHIIGLRASTSRDLQNFVGSGIPLKIGFVLFRARLVPCPLPAPRFAGKGQASGAVMRPALMGHVRGLWGARSEAVNYIAITCGWGGKKIGFVFTTGSIAPKDDTPWRARIFAISSPTPD